MSLIFKKMSQEQFDEFLQWRIDHYAQKSITEEKVEKEKAYLKWISFFKTKFPMGVETEGQVVATILSDMEIVGSVWYTFFKDHIYLNYIHINENYRHKGYGRKSMINLEMIALANNYEVIKLNVFRDNIAAHNLYDSLSYKSENGLMIKKLK